MKELQADFDLPVFSESPPIIYVICSTPRSGSTLLSRMLSESGVAGFPMEYFNRYVHLPTLKKRFGVSELNELIPQIMAARTSPNGCFGFKAHYDQFIYLGRRVDIDTLMPNLKYIWIDRLDLLGQAISYSKALQTGAWKSSDNLKAEPVFSEKHIMDALGFIASRKRMWNTFFALTGHEPYRVTYEDLCANPCKTIGGILDFMGLDNTVPIDLTGSTMQIQRDEETLRWIRMIHERNSLAMYCQHFDTAYLPSIPKFIISEG